TGLYVCEPIHLTARPADFHCIGLRPASDSESEYSFALRKIARATAEHLCLRFAACGQSNHGSKPITIGTRPDKTKPHAVVGSPVVTQQNGGTAIRGHHNIEIAVVIEVAICGAAGDSWLAQCGTQRLGDFGKRTFARVAKHVSRLRVLDSCLNALDI